jgi:hypothetical protein
MAENIGKNNLVNMKINDWTENSDAFDDFKKEMKSREVTTFITVNF